MALSATSVLYGESGTGATSTAAVTMRAPENFPDRLETSASGSRRGASMRRPKPRRQWWHHGGESAVRRPGETGVAPALAATRRSKQLTATELVGARPRRRRRGRRAARSRAPQLEALVPVSRRRRHERAPRVPRRSSRAHSWRRRFRNGVDGTIDVDASLDDATVMRALRAACSAQSCPTLSRPHTPPTQPSTRSRRFSPRGRPSPRHPLFRCQCSSTRKASLTPHMLCTFAENIYTCCCHLPFIDGAIVLR